MEEESGKQTCNHRQSATVGRAVRVCSTTPTRGMTWVSTRTKAVTPMPKPHTIFSALLILCLTPGCDKGVSKTAPTSAPPKAVKAIKAPPPGAVHGAGDTGGGLAGAVIETMDSGGYSYLKLKTASGEKWAAVKQGKFTVGQQVTIAGAMEMKNFKSKTLDRLFPSIHFGTLGTAGAAADPHAGMAMGKGKGAGKVDVSKAHSGLGSQKAALDKPIAKAAGPTGQTVAGVYANKASLKDKEVTVRGKVVKVNTGIMGRNWLHIQDGSGAVATSNFDLTVTSKEVAEKGKVVVIKGTVRLDKDFGAGYRYAVIVEDAKITK